MKLLVENELCPIEELRTRTIEFIDNNGRNPELSDSPQKAVVSFKADRGTSYERYIDVYNELKASYNTLRDATLSEPMELLLQSYRILPSVKT